MAGLHEHELATPTLMRAARGAYAQSIRAQLHSIGVDDLPRNGAFLLAGIDTTGGPREDLPAGLGVTKQAVSQVIEVLVSRGYLERNPDPGDRRRITLGLTGRGQEVVGAVVRGVEAVDAQLLERVPAEQVDAMRSALLALSDIKTDAAAAGAGRRRPPRQVRQFSPIFPVRDMRTGLAHYAALGFDTFPYAGEDDYGFANREGIGLHLAADPGHDPAHSHASAYLYVRDADALYAEWARPGIGGQTRPVGPTPYGLREGSHVDPDGNLIRFGSRPPGPAHRLSAWSVTSSATIAALTALWGLLASMTSLRTAIAIAGLLMLATPLLLPRHDGTPQQERELQPAAAR